MRLSAKLALSFAFLFLAAEASRAQLELPLADYNGKLKVVVSCPDGTTTKFKAKGAVSITNQAGFNVQSSAEFVGKRKGVECTLSLALTGAVNPLGRWIGTYTSTIVCSDGTMTQGVGDFDAKYVPGKLTMILEGQDDDCLLTASFDGKGSPGTALCAALTYQSVGKLSKKYFAAWSKFLKAAHTDSALPKLQAKVTKAHTGFAKASEKAAKKSKKAGGSCSKGPTPPGSVTAKIKADTLDKMMSGFNSNQPLDRVTRSRLAKYQSQYLVSLLKAESDYTLKLDPLQRAASMQAARDKFVERSINLLVKATAQGLVWTGPPPQGMAMDIEGLVAFIVAYYE